MNRKSYLVGYLEKRAGLEDRPLAYAANVIPYGSTLYGAANATPKENIVKQGIRTAVGGAMGTIGGGVAGGITTLGIAALLALVSKGKLSSSSVIPGSVAGGAIGGGEATYRVGKKKKPEIV